MTDPSPSVSHLTESTMTAASRTRILRQRGLIGSLLLFLQSNHCLLVPSHAFSPSGLSRYPRYSQSHASTSSADYDSLDHDEIARYSRHLVLQDVGIAGQLALKRSSVLVIGAGGLGSPCLLYLAAAGVGHVGIVDADTVDTSNLQRQIIHATSTVGKTKCQSAAERIKDINPKVNLRLYEQEFTAETARDILGGGFCENRPYDIVIDGSDNFPTKYLIK